MNKTILLPLDSTKIYFYIGILNHRYLDIADGLNRYGYKYRRYWFSAFHRYFKL